MWSNVWKKCFPGLQVMNFPSLLWEVLLATSCILYFSWSINEVIFFSFWDPWRTWLMIQKRHLNRSSDFYLNPCRNSLKLVFWACLKLYLSNIHAHIAFKLLLERKILPHMPSERKRWSVTVGERIFSIFSHCEPIISARLKIQHKCVYLNDYK